MCNLSNYIKPINANNECIGIAYEENWYVDHYNSDHNTTITLSVIEGRFEGFKIQFESRNLLNQNPDNPFILLSSQYHLIQ